MSLIDGLTPSADWVAKDMETMLRECDALIASKDEHLSRLKASITALETEAERVGAERAQVIADREKAEGVLSRFQAAVEEGRGLREARRQGETGSSTPAPDSAETPPVEDTEEETSGPSSHTAETPHGHPVRIAGGRSIAAMRIIERDPERGWSPRDVAVELEGEAEGAVSRTRTLLESLSKRQALRKIRGADGIRSLYRLAGAWEAA
ncbi:hypothetical protein ACWGI8_01220 [Streptomyces sp. NPDC054841]